LEKITFRTCLFVSFLLISSFLQVFAEDPALKSKVESWMQKSGTLRFTENKGQMSDLQGQPVNDLLFRAGGAGMDLYVTSWGLSYVFAKAERSVAPGLDNSSEPPAQAWHNEMQGISIQYCRADMELVGATIKKENTVKEYESEDRTDFYLAHCPEGVRDVHSYEKITIRNVYPGIDWVLYSLKVGKLESQKRNASGLKYDFIVHPGADPSLIRLRYKWTDKPLLQKDGSVKISTPEGDLMEGAPVSYGQDRAHVIPTHYALKNNELGFTVGAYNTNEILVIDPSLTWATYYLGGGPAGFYQEIQGMHTDGASVWVTGRSNYKSFPTINPHPGTAYFEATATGTASMIILQFSSCGQLIWSTYYGGSGHGAGGGGAAGTSINSDGTSVWVTGNTYSSDFPTKALVGAYNQAIFQGDNDLFVLQFSCSTNARIWATYYGGSNGDFGNSISSDGKNVWVTGYTQSTDFPLLTPGGSYKQGALGGAAGNKDVFILKFSCGSSALEWATYYGGSGGDVGNGISSDGTNVWVTGATNSNNFSTQRSPSGLGYYQAALAGGGGEVFILEFNCSNCSRIWATYYGGKSSDVGNSISSDGTNVWVTGNTYSSTFPTQRSGAAYYQAALAGVQDLFILQFSCTTSACVWATYYGGTGSVQTGYSIQSDGKNVWVSGSTNATDFPTTNPVCTNGFYQNSPAGNLFILQFSTSGSVQWATYYGNDTENDGSYITSDGTSVFVTGDAQGGSKYPLQSYPGAYYQTTPTTGINEILILAKFNISCSAVWNFSASRDTSICSGDSVQLKASGANSYSWAPASGLSSTTDSVVTARPASTMTYTVTGTSSINCSSLTATVTVTIATPPTISADSSGSLNCNVSSVMLTGTSSPGNTLIWNGGSLVKAANPATVTTVGTYTVLATDLTGCTASSSVTVISEPNPVITDNITNTCQGNKNGIITASASGTGDVYNWNNGKTGPVISGLDTGTYIVTVTDKNGCTAADTASVLLLPLPLAEAGTAQTIIPGQKVQLTASGGLHYLWTPAASLNSATIYNPIADPNQTTNYHVIVTDVNNCSAMDSVLITVTNCEATQLFMPTAFSPNGDGQNDVLYLRGPDCITQLHLMIYDRWGELVFETSALENGWTGVFRNKMMDPAVFVYYLTATLSNGQQVNQKGNLTLLR